MSTTLLPLPPLSTPVYDESGAMTEPWRRYWLAISTFVGTEIPPIDAQYWVSTANNTLTNERNIGALPTGWLKVTTAAGIAVPSTQAHIPGTDITPHTIPNSALANMADATVKGRALGAGTGAPQDLTGAQIAAIIGSATGSTSLVDSLFLMGG